MDAVSTRNLQAWEAYQLGKQRMAKRTIAGLTDAEQFFREAIKLDPRFALGYVGLADTLSLQTQYGLYGLYSDARRESTLSNAERAVAEALKLDSDLAEAWASAGLAAYYREHSSAPNPMFRRAIELNPNYAPARSWYFMLLDWLDRPDGGACPNTASGRTRSLVDSDQLKIWPNSWRCKAAFTKHKHTTDGPS